MDLPISKILNINYSNTLSVIMGIITLGVGAYVYFRKTNIEEYTSKNTIKVDQTKSLLQQIDFLSEELTKTRQQLTDIHNQNIELMERLRQANLRIQKLELFIAVKLKNNHENNHENCIDSILDSTDWKT